ncbi:MAG TPA: peptide chain release factor-like protein [Candidatus Hydrogenedentes bacterium]|nr:peptide chain release factor-like protein [Candidatus Hydrogenedentota bacterium]HPG65713.1 peptide chain release factor-like protein [Candidatus Hydrogenedentota bacterium]
MEFTDDEIEITYYRSSGPGGQKKNVTESAVRVRHLPSGIIVVATSSRSQFRNREAALAELARRLAERRRPRKRRIATRPTTGSRCRRLEEKRQRGAVKASRRTPSGE